MPRPRNAQLDHKFMAFALWIHQHVIIPFANFVATVYEQVKYNISSPVPPETLFTAEESESTTEGRFVHSPL